MSGVKPYLYVHILEMNISIFEKVYSLYTCENVDNYGLSLINESILLLYKTF